METKEYRRAELPVVIMDKSRMLEQQIVTEPGYKIVWYDLILIISVTDEYVVTDGNNSFIDVEEGEYLSQ